VNDDLIVLARIGRPRGMRGEILLHLETDRPASVLSAPGRYLLDDGRAIEVEELIERNGRWSWVVKGRPPREDLAEYVNGVVVADPTRLPPRDDGEIDEHRLIGCRLLDPDGAALGVITGVERRYEIDTWLVRLTDGREAEIPAVAAFILAVDLDRRAVTVAPHGILSHC
jgi:16S rRNA processing protein RimM